MTAADLLQRLWAPHRMAYVTGDDPSASEPGDECPFYSRCPLRTDECLVRFPDRRSISPDHSVACIHSSELMQRSNAELASLHAAPQGVDI